MTKTHIYIGHKIHIYDHVAHIYISLQNMKEIYIWPSSTHTCRYWDAHAVVCNKSKWNQCGAHTYWGRDRTPPPWYICWDRMSVPTTEHKQLAGIAGSTSGIAITSQNPSTISHWWRKIVLFFRGEWHCRGSTFRADEVSILSHTKCFEGRVVEVDFHTYPPTHSLYQ